MSTLYIIFKSTISKLFVVVFYLMSYVFEINPMQKMVFVLYHEVSYTNALETSLSLNISGENWFDSFHLQMNMTQSL